MLATLALALLPALQELEPAAMRADLEALEEGIRERWSYLALREEQGLDLVALLARARERTAAPLPVEDFARVLRELVSALQDGHAYVHVPDAKQPVRRLPFLLRDAREGPAIARVGEQLELLEGGPAPRIGELVRALGGRPLAELHAEAMARSYASTPGMRRQAGYDELGRLDEERLVVELEDLDGVRRTVVLRTPVGIVPGLDTWLEPEPWAVSFPREGVALLRIPSFSPPDWKAWGAATPEERDGILAEQRRELEALFARVDEAGARALVLDLRGNGGGTDLLGIHLAKHLVPGRFVYYGLASKRFLLGWSKTNPYRYEADDGLRPFHGPLVALIDEGCFSVTDNLLRCLDEAHPDATFVGRPSGGGTGAPRKLEPLPHSEAEVTLCTMRVYGPKGELIEGSGTVPDVPVTWSRADLAAGRDPDLAAALALLDERLDEDR